MKIKNFVVAGAALAVSAVASAAAPATVTDLAAGISFADVGLGILAVASALITLAVLQKGAKKVLGFIGR